MSLHPDILSKCRKLYDGGDYAEAVEKGFKVVRDKLRRRCCVVGSCVRGEGKGMKHHGRVAVPVELPSAFSGFRFPPEGLSYRDLESLLAERGVEVDHVTLHRWVQRFTPLLIDAARPCRHAVGRRWFVDETYVKVAGVWRYVYRAVDGYGQVIDVYVSVRRDIAAARTFFTAAIAVHGEPDEVVTDKSAVLANVIDELLPKVLHNTLEYANNRVECDHGRLKARLRPMRGLKTDRAATVIIEGHAFIQNLRRGLYELGVEARQDRLRCAAAFDELTSMI
jgi:transposase, IS6 family